MSGLQQRIQEIASNSGAEGVAVAWHDFATGQSGGVRGNEWFHAASTIKIAVLLGVYGAIEEGRFLETDPVQVRNRFFSHADGSVFRVASRRDANAEVHAALGRTMPVGELAFHMIVTSSNLATNLLLDLVGVDSVRKMLSRWKLEGIELVRGVEDETAYEAGISNRVTARGLVGLLRLLHESDVFSKEIADRMVDVLRQQRFNAGIPAGLPREILGKSRVAHKTGEISTVAHDAGLVFLPNRPPYVLAILTRWQAGASGRSRTIARISGAVYEDLTMGSEASIEGS
jgi:beta-lactamase class A